MLVLALLLVLVLLAAAAVAGVPVVGMSHKSSLAGA